MVTEYVWGVQYLLQPLPQMTVFKWLRTLGSDSPFRKHYLPSYFLLVGHLTSYDAIENILQQVRR
jgi:hypothetical protein